MRNTAIHNNRVFSLVEIAIAMIISLCLISIISAAKGRIVAAQGAHTITEMQSILEGARQFFLLNNRWPNNMTELRTSLPKIAVNNLFGNAYNVVPSGDVFYVNTIVPYNSVNLIKDGRFAVISNTGSASLVQLSTTIPMDTKIGRLQYEQAWGD